MTKNVGLLFSVDDTILWFTSSIEQDTYMTLLSSVHLFVRAPRIQLWRVATSADSVWVYNWYWALCDSSCEVTLKFIDSWR